MSGSATENASAMTIHIATTDPEIAACYPVMRELRPHLAAAQFVPQVRRQALAGYRLAYLLEQGLVVAVAGFRTGENLAWGSFLYVDDLVSLPEHRGKGHGAQLLSWLKQLALAEGCRQIHLDSGLQRKDAHRFYQREGMSPASLHFSAKIDGADAAG